MVKQVFSFSVLMLLATFYCCAQNDGEEGRYYWLGISGGGASNGHTSAASFNAELEHFTLGAEFRQSYFGEFFLLFGPPQPLANAINLKAGKLFKGSWWLVHLSGGLGGAQLRRPIKVGETGGWFSSGIYEYKYSGQLSFNVMADASFTIDIYKIGLCAGFTEVGGESTPYVGLSLGFGKFF